MAEEGGGPATLRIPRGLAERLEREARKLGVSLEDYMLELLLGGLDPPELARGYVEASLSLLEEAAEELEKGNTRQAAEKVWGRRGSRCEGLRRLEARQAPRQPRGALGPLEAAGQGAGGAGWRRVGARLSHARMPL